MAEVTDATADDWFAILNRCATTTSNDLMTFPSFGSFLTKLGERKPEIVLHYLSQLDQPLSNFLPWMLRGLARSDRKEEVNGKLAQWVLEKIYLRQIIWYLGISENLDADILEKAVKAALEVEDDAALLNALAVAVRRHGDHADGLIDTVFMPTFTHFAAKNDTQWVNAASHDPNAASLFRDLQPEQADAVLESLVPYPRIEYRPEGIITSVADTWPKNVIDFFGKRLKFSASHQVGENYVAIPFRLNKLRKLLSTIPGYVLDITKTWFGKDRTLFSYRGGRLPAIIFPDFSTDLRDKLVSLARSDRQDIEFVLCVLRNYEGQSFLHDVLKEIVEALPPDDWLLGEVGAILDSMGVVWGEFGIVEAYQQKRKEIEAWRTDPRAKVRSFAERHLLSLDRQIAVEQRRSEEDLELRKRSFGEHDGEEAS